MITFGEFARYLCSDLYYYDINKLTEKCYYFVLFKKKLIYDFFFFKEF